uniref:Death associated protein n=1 Tax=Canis lupus familiaris TaxID=9615 RepID=A0A8I3PAX5_CANLF
MSSPPEGKLETKAGHPPAVKAGGMRIVQKHPHSGDTKEERDKDDQEWESPSPPKPTVFISGVIARVRVALSPLDAVEPCLCPRHPCVGSGAPGSVVSVGRAPGAGAACPSPLSCPPFRFTQGSASCPGPCVSGGPVS